MRTRLFLGEAFRSISTNLSTTFAATMTVLIGMFLLGLFIALFSWVVSWTDHVKGEAIVKVFFVQEASPQQVSGVRARLLAIPEVKNVTFVSKEDALRIMRQRQPELTKNLTSNPFPPAYEVTPRRAEDVGLIASKLEPAPPGVENVTYARQKTERVLQVARIIEIVFLAASVILLLASTILIANTIRLSIFSRRREIEVMKLVGATNWFVRGPFMLEGLICGFLGSVAAVLLLFVGKELALPEILGRVDAGPDIRAWSFEVIALFLVGVGLLLGAAGSGITLRRFLQV